VSRSWRRNRAFAPLPPVVGQDHEDEQDSAGEGWHREEVDGDGRAEMVLEEGRHVCERGVRRRGISREIVRSDTSNPSFNNSP
jgi:hypothetical protein